MTFPASPADFTTCNTKLDSPAAFPFSILLMDPLVMSLSITDGTLLTVSA